ncbi:hypothetical protein NXV91_21185, partial [Bacteroides fragilis]|nr:hypothetical protein [Bacteroides fragilis]
LRASYGLNGNVSKDWVGNYTVQGSPTEVINITAILGISRFSPYSLFTMGTFAQTFIVGMDLIFLENRINGNMTYLIVERKINMPLFLCHLHQGFLPPSNSGKLQNLKGLESWNLVLKCLRNVIGSGISI